MVLQVILLRGMIYLVMNEHEKQRSAVSWAMVRLRRALGKSQTSFAVEDLKVAVSTLARYETSTPPRGNVLLELAKIAERENLTELRDEFRDVFIDELAVSLTSDRSFIHVVRPGDDRPAYGHLLMDLEGLEELDAASEFVNIIEATRSADPAVKKRAEIAIKSLSRAAAKCKSNQPDHSKEESK
jgi:hypothetical protein